MTSRRASTSPRLRNNTKPEITWVTWRASTCNCVGPGKRLRGNRTSRLDLRKLLSWVTPFDHANETQTNIPDAADRTGGFVNQAASCTAKAFPSMVKCDEDPVHR